MIMVRIAGGPTQGTYPMSEALKARRSLARSVVTASGCMAATLLLLVPLLTLEATARGGGGGGGRGGGGFGGHVGGFGGASAAVALLAAPVSAA